MKLTSDITVELVDMMGNDSTIVQAARVSTRGKEDFEIKDDDYKLINYLVKQRHGTPFEHTALTFRVHAPIFVWREHHRHRVGFSYNEESGRYKQLEPVFWIPKPDRKIIPVEGYKAARPEFQAGTEFQHTKLCGMLEYSYSIAYQQYEDLLSFGYAKEVARACLPVAIYSSCYVTCNLRSLMHFLGLRTHDKDAKFVSYPQSEIEEVARQYEECFKEYWPVTYKAFLENGRVSP